uniref:ATP synthase subunit a n=1 Tax=Japanagallia turriformis TaxID=3071388 RepID=A0AA50KUX3_9HEMI|nr:ATP synthase F0 subunit 6 [Japanagallia turriformis]WMC21080.1 ATP synthase F0 subunit 6 [Japanagallia turriformis]
MTNLFSTFDPCTGTLSLNWISIFMITIILPLKFWNLPNKQMMVFNKMISMINNEIKMLMKYKGTSIMLISIFLLILINNMMGLMPYIFTSSSHLVYSLTLALPLWLGMMLYGWINKTNKMFTHMVPMGTPSILMPFMVMIETISNLIRPGSLAVRLTANMIAGHLLMSLLGNNCSMSMVMMFMSMIMFITLMLFETAVAMIQAYVFMTLSTLYSSEI